MGNYNLPLTTECDADSPLNETLFNVRIRGTLLGLGYANSVFGTHGGSGADGVGPVASGDLDCGVAGKQFSAWTVGAGVLQRCTTTNGMHRFGVTGTFTLAGTLDATGRGCVGVATGVGPGTHGGESLAVSNCGNGGATGGSAMGGSWNGSRGGDGGNSYSDGDSIEGGWGQSSALYGSYSGSGKPGRDAKTAVLGSWYANPSILCPGAAGGSQGNNGYVSIGDIGKNGGGCVIVECDTFIFSAGGCILAAGDAATRYGGAGAGGNVVVVCRVLQSNDGTVTVNGGAGFWLPAGFLTPARWGGGPGGNGRYAIVVLGAQKSSGT